MPSKYFLFLPTMADQTQRVGEAHVLDENWPSQLVGFPEAVTLCQLCGFQSNNKKTHWGHSSRKTRSLFWGIHHKIPLCQKKGNYLFNVICGGSPWVFRGQISLRCWLVSRLATKPAMISLIIPHIPLIGLQNPRKAYQNIVTFLPITRYSILLTWQCFFMYRLHNLTPQRKREYAILYLATRHVGRGI